MNIYSFKDPIDFLEAAYQDLKAPNPDFSVRKWASQMGIESHELLFDVMKRKKKIPLLLISNFAHFFSMNESESKFFETLVLLSRATSNTEVRLFREMLAEQRGLAGESVAIVNEDNIFSHWIHMVILSTSKLKGFHCSVESLTELVGADVSPEIIQEAVDRLLRLNLIHTDSSGSLRKSFDHTTTKNDVSKAEVHKYYFQVNDLARKAMDFPVDQREFQCFSMAIKHDEIQLFKEAIRQFRFKVASITPEGTGDQVYQFNVQFFPLTSKIENTNVRSNVVTEELSV